jgi:hypothetical protein
VSILFFLTCLIVAPAVLTWLLVKLVLWRDPDSSSSRVLKIAVPLAAIAPLLPAAAMVAVSREIYNPALIAVMGTLLVGTGDGLCVCLPVALALTRGRPR